VVTQNSFGQVQATILNYVRVTQIATEALVTQTDALTRVTQISTEALITQTDVSVRVTQIAIEVLRQNIPNRTYGQAQADIKAISRGFGQAQGYLQAPFSGGFGQAQADILQTYQAYAQSQADITQTYNGYAQTQAALVVTLQVYAQAQSNIKSTSNVFGQSQADILATTDTFAQAQSDIRATYNGYGQAQASIIKTFQVYGQSQADIKSTNNGFAQSQADIKTSYQTYSQSQGDIKASYQGYGQSQAALVKTLVALGQVQSDIKSTINTFGQSQSDIKAISNKFAQAQSDTKVTTNSYAQSQASLIKTYQIYGQSQADIDAITLVYGQAQADILSKSNAYGQANAKIIIVSYSFGQVRAVIFDVGLRSAFAQAQANILAITYQTAWVQGTITTTTPNAAVQALISKSAGYAHVQAVIIRSIAWAQAMAQIKRIQLTRGWGQARAFILNKKKNAQAQAWIRSRPQAFSQTRALINYRFGLAHTQARMLGFGTTRYAQAKARIRTSSTAFAQASVRIKSAYSGYGQAQGQIILGSPNRGFGQSQAYLNTFGYIRTGLARAYINTVIIEDLLINAHTYSINSGYNETAFVNFAAYGSDVTDPDPLYSGQFPADGTWEDQFGDLPTQSAPNGWAYFTLSSTMYVHFDTLTFYDRTHDTMLGLYTGVSVPGAWEVIASNDDTVFNSNPTYESIIDTLLPAGTYLLQVGMYAYSVERYPTKKYSYVRIGAYSPVGIGQAQAFIKPPVYGINSAGQARASINQPNPRQYGQVKALVTNKMGFGQAKAQIKVFGTSAYGQAQARLWLRFYPSNAANEYQRMVVADGAAAYYTLGEPLLPGGTTGGSPYQSSNMLYKDRVWDNLDLYDLERTYGTSGNGPYGGDTIGTYVATLNISSLSSYFSEPLGIPGAKAPSGLLSKDETHNGFNQLINFEPYIPLRFTDWAIEFWYKTLESIIEDDTLIRIGGPDADDTAALSIVNSAGTLKVIAGQGGFILEGPSYGGFEINKWHHIVVKNDGYQNSQIWVNGELVANKYVPTWNFIEGEQLIIVHPNDTSGSIFVMDQLALYDWFLEDDLIRNHYFAGIKLNVGFGTAMAYIRPIVGLGQALAEIFNPWAKACARALIITAPHKVGQAQAYIKDWNTGMSMALITRAHSGLGQAQGRISLKSSKSGQAKALIGTTKPTGQAQALIDSSRYLVSYNGYHLPGYAQNETLESVAEIKTYGEPYRDSTFSEYYGLVNKNLTISMLVRGENYLDCKNQIELATTLVRSKRKGFAPLYVNFYDRHFEALTKSVKTDANTGNIYTSIYSVDFEAKPWLISDSVTTISGASLLTTTGRTLDNGGWTPTKLIVSGTNVTVSGYTATGDFTGFVSISGAVTNFEIDSEAYETTDNSVLNNADYEIYVGPGVTNFVVTGATDCIITYHDRWYL